jgi:hypothetical protein
MEADESVDSAIPTDQYVVKDAIWVVESREYVDPGPRLESSLSDDPRGADTAWHLALRTLRDEAAHSSEPSQAEVEAEDRTVRQLAERLRRKSSEEATARPHADSDEMQVAAMADTIQSRASMVLSRTGLVRLLGRAHRSTTRITTARNW